MWFFLHSAILALLSSQMPYPNRFSNCDIIFLISKHFSVFPFFASCHGQNLVPAWSEGEAIPCHKVALQCQSEAVSGANRRDGGTYLSACYLTCPLCN